MTDQPIDTSRKAVDACLHYGWLGWHNRLLRAVANERDAARVEIERLTKERDYKQTVIEKLSDHIEKAEAERDEATSTLELVNSNNLTLAAELAGWKQLRKEAEAERDRALAQVGALLDENSRLNAAMLVLGAYLMEKGEAFRVGEGAELLDAYSAALTPADTKAALETRDREKVREGMRRAASLFKDANHGKHIMDAILAAMEKEGEK